MAESAKMPARKNRELAKAIRKLLTRAFLPTDLRRTILINDIKLLLKDGANPENLTSSEQQNCINLAIQNGDTEILELLVVQLGCKLCAESYSDQLHNIITNTRILELLLQHHNNDVELPDAHSFLEALHTIMAKTTPTRKEDCLAACRLLVQRAAQNKVVRQFIQDMLCWTAIGFWDLPLKLLLDAGAAHVVGTSELSRVLSITARVDDDGNSCESTWSLLVAHGADPFHRDDDHGEGKIVESCFECVARQGKVGLLSSCLQIWDDRYHGRDGKNEVGECPIHALLSIESLPLESVQVLINHNPESLGMVSKHGWLPFHLACIWGRSLNIIYTLLSNDTSAVLGMLDNALEDQQDASEDAFPTRPPKRRKMASH